MGRNKRPMPVRLGEKLKAIREHLALSTEKVVERLDCPSTPLHKANITHYEKGRREPPSIVLLQYARLVKVSVETLIDDKWIYNLNSARLSQVDLRFGIAGLGFFAPLLTRRLLLNES